jgi:hypothetical protein
MIVKGPLQVWLGGYAQLVGHLTSHQTELDARGRLQIHIDHAKIDEYGGVFDESRSFQLDTRNSFIHQTDIIYFGIEEMKKRFWVPESAVEFSESDRPGLGFRWPVLMISLEDYEWVFDLPAFEPADHKEPDIQARIDVIVEADDSWTDAIIRAPKLNVAALNALSASLGSAIAGPPTTNSANTSTLTVEKLKDAMKLMQATMPMKIEPEPAKSGLRYLGSNWGTSFLAPQSVVKLTVA